MIITKRKPCVLFNGEAVILMESKKMVGKTFPVSYEVRDTKISDNIKGIDCNKCFSKMQKFSDFFMCLMCDYSMNKNGQEIILDERQLKEVKDYLQQRTELIKQQQKHKIELENLKKTNKYFVKESAFDKDMKENRDD